jgi:hypothetical protein
VHEPGSDWRQNTSTSTVMCIPFEVEPIPRSAEVKMRKWYAMAIAFFAFSSAAALLDAQQSSRAGDQPLLNAAQIALFESDHLAEINPRLHLSACRERPLRGQHCARRERGARRRIKRHLGRVSD